MSDIKESQEISEYINYNFTFSIVFEIHDVGGITT